MSIRLGDVLIAGANPVPTGVMVYKGTVLQANLPTSGQQVGDYYKLADTVAPYQGQCAIWNGATWDYSSSSLNVDNSLSTTSSNAVENKVITAGINDRLSLSGGTMTGVIINNASEGILIKRNDNNSQTSIYGATTWGAGAGIDLYGKDHNRASGWVSLFANDGTTLKQMFIKPNGSWVFDNVEYAKPQDITSEYFATRTITEGYYKAVRVGKVVTITIDGVKSSDAFNLVNIPDKYRPAYPQEVVDAILINYNDNTVRLMQVSRNANVVRIHNAVAGASYWGSCTYIID